MQALHRARADVGGATSGGFTDIESASLVAFPRKDDAELAWEVWVDSPDGILYESVVSASTGKVLAARVAHRLRQRLRVGQPPAQRPLDLRKTFNLAADPSWLSDSAGRTRLAGNNAHAYADVNGTNGNQARRGRAGGRRQLALPGPRSSPTPAVPRGAAPGAPPTR